MRLHFRDQIFEAPNVTILRLDPENYARLVAAIAAAMAMDDDGRAIPLSHPGYGGDMFLEGNGRYSPILTCNEWASRGLARAGVRTAVWSPFPNGVTVSRK